ncbi:ornithine carbamoyltransferase, partial [Pseudomonas aeruginosa]|nr:ornithine carbamoyltransferase [Pseudomonas aeruginosa]
GIPHRYLDHKNIALLFEKNSTRTRAAFTVASIDLGAHPEFLGKNDIQLGKKESVEDTAKVLGRMFDGIEFRGFSQEMVEDLAKYSGVPVWNGLTDAWHPTQMLADYMTVKENFGHLDGIKLTYVGDGRNNVANSLLVAGPMLGVDVTICSPKALFPSQDYVDIAERRAKQDGGSITITDNIDEGVKDADVIYTDVWVSMGEESEFESRIKLLKDYQVNRAMFDKTGKDSTIFLHCLPAFHDTNTTYGQQIKDDYGLSEMEVTDEIFRSKHSKVFDQAENRMHTIKAVMAATLG